jgi:glucose-1-phosphate thymidylyltransferase
VTGSNASEDVRKAVILARGLGTRMRRPDPGAALDAEQASLADEGLKAMIPVGRPFLDYVLGALADAGITEVCLVIGPEHQRIREYYTRTVRPRRLSIRFVVQERPAGTADALLAAETFIAGDAFLVLNADNYYPIDILAGLRRQPAPALPAFERAALSAGGNIPPERIARYALLEIAPDGRLIRIHEKPDEATERRLGGEARVSMNLWLLTPGILHACRAVPLSPRGEYELPLAVQHAVDAGAHIHAWPVAASVLDLSQRADVDAVKARLENIDVQL